MPAAAGPADAAALDAPPLQPPGQGLPPVQGPLPAAASAALQRDPTAAAAAAGGGAGAAGAGADPADPDVVAATAAAHRAAVAAGKQPANAAPNPAWSGLGMSPADAPLAAAALRGQQADVALTAALLAAKSEASAAQERVRVAALAWERERATADTLALRVAEAERFLRVSSGQPVDPEHGTSSHQALPAGSGARYDPTDPMVA